MRALGLVACALVACRPPAPPREDKAPRNVVMVGPGPAFTVIMGSFTAARDVRYHDANCLAVPMHDGAEPVSAPAGRLETWVVAGDILGHVERNRDGVYQAAVRTVLPAGTRVAANIPGSADVPAHRFRTPAMVPTAVRREAPAAGFVVRVGEGLPVRWSGGSGSHVTLTLTLEPAGGHGAGLLVTCAAPARAGAFTIPAAALTRALVPDGVVTARLAVAATDRAREGDYALDVVLVSDGGAEVSGTVAR